MSDSVSYSTNDMLHEANVPTVSHFMYNYLVRDECQSLNPHELIVLTFDLTVDQELW